MYAGIAFGSSCKCHCLIHFYVKCKLKYECHRRIITLTFLMSAGVLPKHLQAWAYCLTVNIKIGIYGLIVYTGLKPMFRAIPGCLLPFMSSLLGVFMDQQWTSVKYTWAVHGLCSLLCLRLVTNLSTHGMKTNSHST